MPNQKNIDTLNILKEKLAGAKSVIFAEYHGLTSNQVNDLRSKIKESGAEMSVAKNTLIKVALNEENPVMKSSKELSAKIDEELKGPIATIFSYSDAIASIKVLAQFAQNLVAQGREVGLPKIKAGIIDGEFASAEKIGILSSLPSREELLAKLVGTLKSPLSGLVNVLNGNQRKLVYALSAIAKKRSQESNS